MRILYHHRTQAEDAQGVHIQEMVNAFKELGHEVEMVALVKPGAGSSEKKKRPWTRLLKATPDWFYELMALSYNLYGYISLCRVISERRPDMIYERYSLNTFCGVWASRKFGIPLILEVNAPLYKEQKALGKLAFESLARFSEKWICSNTTRTITVTNVMKEILISEGIPGNKITVMSNGVNLEEFNKKISGSPVRRKFGIENTKVMGFVGWFRPWHGLEMLLEVFNEKKMWEDDVSLMLIGDGPACPDLKRFVEKNGLNDHVIFTGPVGRKEMPAHIAALDIALQPSVTEYACPMKIIEYMAMGKCIVAPDQPNIREIIGDRVNGILFRKEDKKSLSEVLKMVIDDKQMRETVASRAYESVFERGYLWRVNAMRALELLSLKEAINVVNG